MWLHDIVDMITIWSVFASEVLLVLAFSGFPFTILFVDGLLTDLTALLIESI